VATRPEAGALPADVPDGPLLQRFLVDGDQSAFAALVRRHERLVLRVCQRVLGNLHAAHDAFQLTFLTLARKAGTLDLRSPLAGWLYKVAYHLSLRLRGAAAARRRAEEQATDGRPPQAGEEPGADLEQRELRLALHEELDRLPEKYRAPLVLCYFDGHTHDEAARAIGLPRGSMAKRLAEGLDRLRERLLVRGFVP
jgi:RNA polymerase sigma factor (sigma-70 family)